MYGQLLVLVIHLAVPAHCLTFMCLVRFVVVFLSEINTSTTTTTTTNNNNNNNN